MCLIATLATGCATRYRVSGGDVPGDISTNAATRVPANAEDGAGRVRLELRPDDWVFLCDDPGCDGEGDTFLQVRDLPPSLSASQEIHYDHRNPGIAWLAAGGAALAAGLAAQYGLYADFNSTALAIPVIGPIVAAGRGYEWSHDRGELGVVGALVSTSFVLMAVGQVAGIGMLIKGANVYDSSRERPDGAPAPVFSALPYPEGGGGVQLGFRF